uniref:Uncharacterized protein n=1 Tax=Caenorhabditis japonica TaxID=281687 RepID=A0A8R1EI39_CAEJA
MLPRERPFKSSTVAKTFPAIFPSNMPQTLKSIGLRSGLEAGHKFLSRNPGKCASKTANVDLEPWDGAQSC